MTIAAIEAGETHRDDECRHLQSEIRWRKQRNGVRIYQRQCLDCFQVVGTMVPHREVNGDVPPFDEAAREAYWQDRHAMYQAAANARQRAWEQQRAARQMQYLDYLKSDKWRWKRKAVLVRDDYRCQAQMEGCEDDATQAHHKTYDRIFNEALFDLVAVCRNCHKQLHDDG